ncbi:MAG: hypothetical protein E6Q45_08820 [Flavobacterium sp.]|nr:MAG: hypothetical protein E6Q45_08820 [Flavobacterium sp.]
MKLFFYIFIILLVASCKNPKETDKVAVKNTEKDTIFKTSKPFKINNINAFWKYYITPDKEITMELRQYKTNKILLVHSDISQFEYNFLKNKNYTDEKYLENFRDVNFDDNTDFVIYSNKDSGSGGSFFVIYLFDNKKKAFEHSEELSGGEAETNIANRTLTTYWKSGVSINTRKIYHFGKNGEVEFTERFYNEHLEENIWKKEYEKTIKGKVVEQRTDTLKE